MKNIGLPNVGANMVNMASNPLLANAGTGLGANPLLSNTPFANPKVGLNANVNGKRKTLLCYLHLAKYEEGIYIIKWIPLSTNSIITKFLNF